LTAAVAKPDQKRPDPKKFAVPELALRPDPTTEPELASGLDHQKVRQAGDEVPAVLSLEELTDLPTHLRAQRPGRFPSSVPLLAHREVVPEGLPRDRDHREADREGRRGEEDLAVEDRAGHRGAVLEVVPSPRSRAPRPPLLRRQE